jgi:Immunoglobulin-like domain of bacterial spore germination
MNAEDRTDPTTDLLKQALTDEAAVVEPEPGGLQRIQARIADPDAVSRRTRRRWLLVTPLGAGLAAAAVIFGIVLANGGSNNGTDGTPAVSQPGPHQGVYDPSAPASQQFTMWYRGPVPANPQLKPRLFSETHTVADPGSDAQLAAVQEFLTSTAIDPDYGNPWGPWSDGPVTVTAITESAGVTEFDLNATPSLFANPTEQHLGLQALARSAGLDPGDAFGICINGTCDDVAYAVQADDAVRAWISIDNIVDGQTMSNPVTVQVSGNVFEGNVNWTLLNSDGVKVDEGYVTTSMGMWTQAPVDLGTLDPGTYTFKAIEYSMEDGSIQNQDDKTFTVQ